MDPGASGDRLDGWEEIAAYLDRDVTTVIRWERGLPVHRLPGERRGAVFAYRAEIERWLGKAIRDSDAAPGSVALDASVQAPPLTPVEIAPPTSLRRSMITASVIVLASVAGGWGWRAYSGAALPEVARVELRSQAIVAFDAADRELWTVPFDQPLLKRPWPPAIVVSDVDGDGRREVVASVEVEQSPGFGRGELLLLGGDGTVRWRRVLEDQVVFRSARGSAPWQDGFITNYRTPEGVRIAWAQGNTPSWPGIVAVFNADGRRVGTFVHSGAIYALQVLGGPQRPLLVGAGISNSQRAVATFVLDGRDVQGHSVEPPGSEFECLSCAAGAPLRYFVFPPTEISRASGGPYNALTSVTTRGAGLELQTQENFVLENGSAQQIFTFDGDLRLLRSLHSDSWPAHDFLQKRGKLDHSAADCPMYRTPPVALEGDPIHGWRRLAASEPTPGSAATRQWTSR